MTRLPRKRRKDGRKRCGLHLFQNVLRPECYRPDDYPRKRQSGKGRNFDKRPTIPVSKMDLQ
ncbi:MAG: hypothetical protein A2X97_10265 [Bdellovibrionales bacterium GWA1_52_35]|nr:MAG: hypothetical protein A2X97_10265 [Bdellovibrionales bacterium GWA1_52_35]HCM38703.1 hypothetical protein [Bdellovibrionales bacterium]